MICFVLADAIKRFCDLILNKNWNLKINIQVRSKYVEITCFSSITTNNKWTYFINLSVSISIICTA